jgi:hypothetical protein
MLFCGRKQNLCCCYHLRHLPLRQPNTARAIHAGFAGSLAQTSSDANVADP